MILKTFTRNCLLTKRENDLKNNESIVIKFLKKNPSYINVLKIINNYFNN